MACAAVAAAVNPHYAIEYVRVASARGALIMQCRNAMHLLKPGFDENLRSTVTHKCDFPKEIQPGLQRPARAIEARTHYS